jgi:hypothetical protein
MPLRPAADFPPSPEPADLEATYQACRAALVSANRSRGALKARLGGVIRELEETADAMVGLIDESERQSGFWLVEMFRRLVQQAKRWRSVKAKAAALASEAAQEAGSSAQLGGES